MKMISKLICFCIFVNLISVNNINANYSVCGSWQTYRNEKCITILDEQKLVTFEDAFKSCTQIDNSSQMLTIHSKEEQDFISEYLFKTHKLVDNVWIGLRNKTKGFEWTDSSNKPYTNWKTGNPNNKPDYNCVQLDSDSMQWTNEPCNKKSLVVCQKLPEVTLSDLLQQVLETKDRLKIIESELKETKEGFNKSEEDLKETKKGLKIVQNERNEIFNIAFNNKVSYYQFFTDLNGKNKAFIIPLSGMEEGYTFDQSVNLCRNFSSTLIEIESSEKQTVLESFLRRLRSESNKNFYFWINGEKNSSGQWKWLKTNTPFTFTNWLSGSPETGVNNLKVDAEDDKNLGKWYSREKAETSNVMCEYTFGF